MMTQVNDQIDSVQMQAAGHARPRRGYLAQKSPVDLIDYLAGHIQTQAEQINQLMAVCQEAAHDMADTGEGSTPETRRAAYDRMAAFLDLAQSLARNTADDGEAIEKIGASIRTAAA